MLWRTCSMLLFTVVVTAQELDKPEWLEVKIAQGTVRGHRDENGELFVFYNIPYATAPTGEHRFRAPLPPPTWTETYDAIDKNIYCPQFIFTAYIPCKQVLYTEDCLVANVYVPDTTARNLPVVVNIHGVAFQFGYGSLLEYKNLLKKKDFIAVNFNYRLGIHGFLCLGTDDAPGNAGMKDQVALLRWVKQNIAAFGGNPNDVTIEGQIAGSASADLLMLSKSAQGLFHKVIPESGANLAAFSIQSDPLQIAKNHAKKFKFENVDDVHALEQFYKTLPFDILTGDHFMYKTDSTFQFVPCVERDTSPEPFLTESPRSILTKGDYKKLPMLYGFSNMEGILRRIYFEDWKEKMNQKFSDFLPADLYFETESEREEIAKQVKEFYFGENPVGNDNILRYVDYFSDVMFVTSTLWAVKLHAKAGHKQVYLYEYSFVDDNVPVVPHTNVRGAQHCAQSLAISDGNNFTRSLMESPEYRKMKDTMREIWHNFIITGEPAPPGSSLPVWPAAGVDRSPHMSLGRKIELRGVLSEESTRFWDKIYEKHYKEPIPPPQPSII